MSWVRFQGHIIEVRGVSGRCIVARDRKKEKPAFVQISIKNRSGSHIRRFTDEDVREDEIFIRK